MKINQLLGLLVLIGGLAVPGLAHARDIVVETGSMSIRVGDDRSVTINGETYGETYGESFSETYEDADAWDIGPSYIYPRWEADNDYRPSRACRNVRNSSRRTHRSYGNQIYSQSTAITRVCQ
ncbi:MAG: hypothetical protein AAF921_18295 [Cyanobacteria bacterium P01_D01_bin.44]